MVVSSGAGGTRKLSRAREAVWIQSRLDMGSREGLNGEGGFVPEPVESIRVSWVPEGSSGSLS